MSINRHNYEEYFILYNDNELNEELKRQVENFVELNTDLKEEFELIKDLKLDPCEQVRFDKSSLYKPIVLQDDFSQPTPDQQKLLLYLDNEMSANDRTELETALNTDANLNKELKQLALTKISPDLAVVFSDKESLYRKEEPATKVVRITWIRVAVAAAVIFLMGLMWLNRTVDEPTVIPSIAQAEPSQKGNELPSVTEEKQSTDNSENKADQSVNENVEKGKEKNITAEAAQAKAGSSQVVNSNDNGSVKNKKPRTTKTGIKTTSTDPNNVASFDRPVLKSNSNSTVDRQISASDIAMDKQERIPDREIVDKPSDVEVKSDYATEALMSDNMPVEPESIAQENGARKGAFRGIIRKANRFINKVTNPDTNGPSVKVASFEIALAK